MVSNFKIFKRLVFSIFPCEKWNDIYFSQFKDGYSAAYKPNYPEDSKNDVVVNTDFMLQPLKG